MDSEHVPTEDKEYDDVVEVTEIYNEGKPSTKPEKFLDVKRYETVTFLCSCTVCAHSQLRTIFFHIF